jgi:DNA-binding response OmpR family regulator
VKTLGVLIITDEPIFSLGLQVQFQKWGFGSIEITNNSELGSQSLKKQAPSLIILDEKFIKKQDFVGLELIAGLMAIPIIVLSPNKDLAGTIAGSWKKINQHTYLCKPCQIHDLQAAVENLLYINVSEV